MHQAKENFKDHFSVQSAEYSRFRPKYPEALFKFLSSLTDRHDLAWDAACGNGQASLGLAEHYSKVIATDASPSMIQNAISHHKIEYSVALAENSGLDTNSADIITVATAIHWINTDIFYPEVRRILKPGGVIAVWIYNSLNITPEIDELLKYFSEGVVNKYWPADAKKLFENNIDFPFQRITAPEFEIEVEWDTQDLKNFLFTWSSVQKYIDAEKSNPIDIISPELQRLWGSKLRRVSLPLKIKVGRV